jgi:hypothetical protein
MENYKLVLCAGAPGSAWSMISNRVKKTFARGFDNSDETPERQYNIPEEHKKEYEIKSDNWQGTTHVGSYFGPYHEFGHGFDNIVKNYSREEFFQECLKPFQQNSASYKLVRSHWFAYNLDWIWENCKGHILFLILREPEPARDWWYSMGGWNIKHPIYTWYEDDKKMWEQIQEEYRLTKEFGEKINAKWYNYDENNSWIQHRFNTASRPLLNHANPKFTDTIKIAYIKIK